VYSSHNSLVRALRCIENINFFHYDDAYLSILLLITLSIRSPGPVTPRDIECEGFNLTYTSIANDKTQAQLASRSTLENDVDQKVNDAIESFLRSLSQIGPELLSVGTS
jgi:hypothetical protein